MWLDDTNHSGRLSMSSVDYLRLERKAMWCFPLRKWSLSPWRKASDLVVLINTEWLPAEADLQIPAVPRCVPSIHWTKWKDKFRRNSTSNKATTLKQKETRLSRLDFIFTVHFLDFSNVNDSFIAVNTSANTKERCSYTLSGQGCLALIIWPCKLPLKNLLQKNLPSCYAL